MPDQAIRILPLAVLGMSYREMSQETGWSVSTVQYWVGRLTQLDFIMDKADVLKDMFSSEPEDNGKRVKRSGRSSVLTSKGAAYMIELGAMIPPGSPIAVPYDHPD